jgi:hypothetical protein
MTAASQCGHCSNPEESVCCTIGTSLRRREIHNIFKKRFEEGHFHNLVTRHRFDGESKLHSFFHLIRIQLGRAVAQAVSRWLPTAAARVRIQAACGVCGEQSGTGAGFLRVLRFPLPIIPPISPSS